MNEDYIVQDNKRLRTGYTTGTCAAAASAAAARALLCKEIVPRIDITVPKGKTLTLMIEDMTRSPDAVRCAVRKDGGDDADATDGILIYATVSLRPEPSPDEDRIRIDGGFGVGRVTREGLDQPVGAAAINSVPRRMIREAVEGEMARASYAGAVDVLIDIPEGEKIAQKTFNPYLGIQGGLSVLGTSGIVEPMSEKAIVETIRIDMRQHALAGEKDILVTPGNYGSDFLRHGLHLDADRAVICSNFLGEVIDMAYEFRFSSFLLVAHIGKLCKVAGGIMNTHSRMADARMDILTSCALLAGADRETALTVYGCVTTDEALDRLEEAGIREETMRVLIGRVEDRLRRRAYDGLDIGAIMFSKERGILGMTQGAEELLALHEKGG